MVLVCLQSSDGKSFEVEMEVAKKSVLIKTLLEDTLVCFSISLFHPVYVDCLSTLVCSSVWLIFCLFVSP